MKKLTINEEVELEDDYITKDTAFLAREKGYLIKGIEYAYARGKTKPVYLLHGLVMLQTSRVLALRTTQSLLAKWIFKYHGVYITVRQGFSRTGKGGFFVPVIHNPASSTEPIARFKTKEDAFEEGLKIALNSLD